MLRILTLVVFGVACQTGGSGGFGGGGNKGGGTDLDTGGTVTNEWPTPVDPDGPSLIDMTLTFDDYPNIGDVIVAQVSYWDPQGDASGGEVTVHITGGDYDDDIARADIDGDDGSSWIEDDSIWFVVSGVHPWESYELVVQAKDKRGNRSNVISGTIEP